MTVSPVESYNEWDQLEEVIVGAIDGAAVPDWNEPAVRATMPRRHAKFFQRNVGRPFPEEFVNLARQELDAFASLLTELGVTVVRPSAADHGRPFTTPN
ncbi:MAG TPA: amidinotransferase, partial [Candidatus Dormibacteraeota bacterium]|nr:amidinotransferase [Candidatus Dormibacteraeota bacterium]